MGDTGPASRMTFETFDFDFNSAMLPPATIRDLATCRFIQEGKNLVLAGPPGIGKTHLAHALGHEAARRGLEAASYKTHKLLELLAPGRLSPRRSELLFKRCLGAGLLILDDFAFRPYKRIVSEGKARERKHRHGDERLTAILSASRLR
jgi:DNA replication protein DnaC